MLSLSATAPPGYIVDRVEANMNGEGITVNKNGDTYSLVNKAPDSGSTELTVYYVLAQQDYTLTYRYYSRDWNADEESNYENNDKVIRENTTPDKTYTVTVGLTDGQIKNGKPISSVLVQYAPAVDYLYKDCKWVINDSYVEYGENAVTITATQPAKTFTVRFFNQDDEFKRIEQAKLNGLVKDEGEFIEAEPKLGRAKFAYWLVEDDDTGKTITKCYSRAFNYRVTANLKVTAVYGAMVKHIDISDPTYSREQYMDGETTVDKLYADFILSYMESSGNLFNPEYAESDEVEALEGYTSGLLIEYDDNIKLTKADRPGAKLSDEEKVEFKSTDLLDVNLIKNYIKGLSVHLPSGRKLAKMEIASSRYNNKNRVDQPVVFKNTEQARHTVFRAYYYVVDAEGNVELSEPVYFYLYDIGNSDANTQ
jgi:hypothetical protein